MKLSDVSSEEIYLERFLSSVVKVENDECSIIKTETDMVVENYPLEMSGNEYDVKQICDESGQLTGFNNSGESFASQSIADNGSVLCDETSDKVEKDSAEGKGIILPKTGTNDAIVNHDKLCIICEKTFKSEELLDRHLKIHIGEEVYDCEVCGKEFETEDEYLQHKIAHTNKIKCKICRRVYRDEKGLNDHLARHAGKSFECNVCSQKYLHKTSLYRHTKKHNCNVCGTKLLSKQHLIDHEKKHSDEKQFKCDICRKAFALEENFYNHKKSHYVADDEVQEENKEGRPFFKKPFRCNVCHQTFRYSDSFRHHKNGHLKECYHCKKMFTTNDVLKIHLKSCTK